ncbi:glutaredoxin family protein [Solidesulfovibrio sp. C21]|uniref:glutaredoxin family protein n=1 Tax=Solidesulfovibrio sp. C21 TaxID=3398613 RepID=UPI0039FBEA31
MSVKKTVSALSAFFAILLFAEALAFAAGPKVEIFMTSWCPYCAKAEAFFKAKGVPFSASDIEKDSAARMRFQKYGQRGVPLVVIGDIVIPGYSVAEYEKALAVAKAGPSASSQPKMVYGK